LRPLPCQIQRAHYEELVAATRAQIASLQAGQPSDRMTERRALSSATTTPRPNYQGPDRPGTVVVHERRVQDRQASRRERRRADTLEHRQPAGRVRRYVSCGTTGGASVRSKAAENS
jgi:hypothetical protein